MIQSGNSVCLVEIKLFQIIDHAGGCLFFFKFQNVIGECSAVVERTVEAGVGADAVIDSPVICVDGPVGDGKGAVFYGVGERKAEGIGIYFLCLRSVVNFHGDRVFCLFGHAKIHGTAEAMFLDMPDAPFYDGLIIP